MLRLWRKNKKDVFVLEIEDFLGFEVGDSALYQEAFAHPSKKLTINYQRLEYLGDAVLNLIIAEYLFKKYKDFNEGELSKLRTRLVNKEILRELALKIGIDKWIKHQLSAAELERSSIYGDMIESLIGAIYLDKGLRYAEKFVKEKIISQFDEISRLEDTDYKSKIIQLSQKQKWKICFDTERNEKEGKDILFTVGLYINGKKVGEAKHYSKRKAEQEASRQALQGIEEKGIVILEEGVGGWLFRFF